MAIVWGGWTRQIANGQRFRIGINLYYKGDPDSGSVTVYSSFYVQAYGSINDGVTLNVSGIHGTHHDSYSWSGRGPNFIKTYVTDVSTNYAASRTASISASITGIYNGLVPRASRSINIRARNYLTPYAPGSFSVTRVSDTQQKLSWTTNYTPADGPRPWTGVRVERKDYVSTRWTQIATLHWSASSWTDTTTTSNNRYSYRLRAYNSSGYSGYSPTSTLSTTPAAPSNVRATKDVVSVLVTWDNVTRIGTSILISASADGGEYTQIDSLSPWAGIEDWTHVNPDSTKTWRYKIRHFESDGSLYSPYSVESNIVQLLTPPAAPSGLSPSSTVLDVEAMPPIFRWTHNPLDTTSQRVYRVDYRHPGDPGWYSTGGVESSDSFLDAATLAIPIKNGFDWEWRVRTWGQYESPSPYSQVAVFRTSTRPTVVINSPETDQVVDTSDITIEWGYYDFENTPQNAYRVSLYNDSGTAIYAYEGIGTAMDHAIPTRLQDGRSYSVSVQVRDDSGLWSAEEGTTAFTVDYAEPPAPILEANWDVERGAVDVYIVNPSYEDTAQVPAEYNEVWRSSDTRATNALVTLQEAEDSRTARGLDSPLTNWVHDPKPTRADSVLSNVVPEIVDEEGEPAVKLVGDGSETYLSFIPTPYMPVPENVNIGEVLYASVETKALKPGMNKGYLSLRLYDGATIVKLIQDIKLEDQGGLPGWQKYEVWHTVEVLPPGSLFRLVYSSYGDVPSGQSVLCRRFQFISGSGVQDGVGIPYFDGGTESDGGTRYGWTGAPDSSPSTMTDAAVPRARSDFELLFERTAELVVGGLAPSEDTSTGVTDNIPKVGGLNAYRATAVSSLPSTSYSTPLLVETEPTRGYVWINTGSGFGKSYRLRGNAVLTPSVERDRATNVFAGRPLPVEAIGESFEESIGVSGKIGEDTSTVEELQEMARTDRPTLFRDPTGRRWYVSPGATSSDYEGIKQTVSLSFKRVGKP